MIVRKYVFWGNLRFYLKERQDNSNDKDKEESEKQKKIESFHLHEIYPFEPYPSKGKKIIEYESYGSE